MDNPIDDLLAVLSLDEHSNSTFTGPGSGHGEFGLFGGHQLAQAVIAAYRSVDTERRLNSLHAFFLRGGDGNQSVTYEVENIRDGRAFCQRRVRTGRIIRQLLVSDEFFTNFRKILTNVDKL